MGTCPIRGVVGGLRDFSKVNGACDREWNFTTESSGKPDTQIEMSDDTAWKLFTKALPEAVAIERVKISGNLELGKPILKMVSVMA